MVTDWHVATASTLHTQNYVSHPKLTLFHSATAVGGGGGERETLSSWPIVFFSPSLWLDLLISIRSLYSTEWVKRNMAMFLNWENMVGICVHKFPLWAGGWIYKTRLPFSLFTCMTKLVEMKLWGELSGSSSPLRGNFLSQTLLWLVFFLPSPHGVDCEWYYYLACDIIRRMTNRTEVSFTNREDDDDEDDECYKNFMGFFSLLASNHHWLYSYCCRWLKLNVIT